MGDIFPRFNEIGKPWMSTVTCDAVSVLQDMQSGYAAGESYEIYFSTDAV